MKWRQRAKIEKKNREYLLVVCHDRLNDSFTTYYAKILNVHIDTNHLTH